jgi:hypothetical protein
MQSEQTQGFIEPPHYHHLAVALVSLITLMKQVGYGLDAYEDAEHPPITRIERVIIDPRSEKLGFRDDDEDPDEDNGL